MKNNCEVDLDTLTIRIESCVCFIQVFIAISVILGDGVYNLAKILFITAKSIYGSYKSREQLPILNVPKGECLFFDQK